MGQTCVFCDTSIGSRSTFPAGSFEYDARSIGMCDSCYSALTNIPGPKDKEAFGQAVCECRRCKTMLYKKDNHTCPICSAYTE